MNAQGNLLEYMQTGLQLNDQLSGVSEGFPIKWKDLVVAIPTSRNNVTTVYAIVF
jgi:hypothetical protein